ncbi:MAG: translation elongation factor 4 [Minisyncoccota bacterium]
MEHIRNFSIIAHIDHGKSTLADRMLEITHTIEKRKMQDQVLDSMELERERGITIKMQPVRMEYVYNGNKYILNLIDTPGHIDFSYEVSRALKAVEGCVLLVDATQGVQAQTLTTLGMAREAGLVIIPVLSKIDSPLARIDDVKQQVIKLLDCNESDILYTSGKTGEGVESLLQKVIDVIPAPKFEIDTPNFRALIFDFKYSTHRGVIVFIRVMNGSVTKNTPLIFKIAKEKFTAIEVGIFAPGEKPVEALSAGETGYIVTGIKEPGIASVGDTVASTADTLPPLHGYMSPSPVVWASIYPESQDDFVLLKQSLGKLKLSDSSYTFDEESSGSLGRGFRCGFLGMLHLEIITERLKREFGLNLVVTMPTITYKVILKNGVEQMVYSPSFFPDDGSYTKVIEPWVNMIIICPTLYLGNIMTLLYEHEAELGESENFGEDRARLSIKMPLREMMRNFFDKMKSATSGYASVSYELNEEREANVTRLDILVADEVMPAFSRVVAKRTVEEEAEKSVEKLAGIMPRQMVAMKIQGKALGRIISSRTMTAFRKDVTQHMYGGDITRKMKLREKQKKGKKKMAERAKVNIPHDVFLKMMRSD